MKIARILFPIILSLFFIACEVDTKVIDTPYGIGIKADGTRAITDKEIEYYVIEDAFLYFYKKNKDIATYIIPKDNITIITPLSKK
jgi:hypothetical protein